MGNSVQTIYGTNRNYKITDVLFDKNPKTISFNDNKTDKKIIMAKYYAGRGLEIKDLEQPILVYAPIKKVKKGMEPLYLVPELCRMTGLPEEINDPKNFYQTINPIKFIRPEEKLSRIDLLI